MRSLINKINAYTILVWSIAFTYIIFGLLKVFLSSPIRDLAEAALPFVKSDILFQLFGICEIILGMGLLFKKSRLYFAIGVFIHLLGTFSTILLAPQLLFSAQLIPTLHGEFVAKNLVILAAVLVIIQKEYEIHKKEY